ncbi:MAG: hypothetical protein M1817_005118 [Caeruleum heppii]|nr:MAG: hypothetical protein M1817_005118 [Caeruleum heppii]
MPITALSSQAVRAIGSSQVLTTPASLVKELIDNALDAEASSVSVEVSLNGLDVIQVKDNGHGIAPEDRQNLARRHHTSKIRDLDDLRLLGGMTLGFRGEALASAAEMAGSLVITTKSEGELVACRMKIRKAGEIDSQERASHPVGTTVRVADFLKHLPVRRQSALKDSARMINATKSILQQYAIARPTTRFSLKVTRAKEDKYKWAWIPKTNASLHEAAINVAGREAVGQCKLREHVCQSSGLVSSQTSVLAGTDVPVSASQDRSLAFQALLPDLNADPSVINNKGNFISIDRRPVNCSRGTLKQILVLFKTYLRSALTKTGNTMKIKDALLCLHVRCPVGSYDSNVEPAKDDVLFADPVGFLTAVEDFFKTFYGELEPESIRETPMSSKSISTPFDFQKLVASKKIQPPSEEGDSNGKVTNVSQSHTKSRKEHYALASDPATPRRFESVVDGEQGSGEDELNATESSEKTIPTEWKASVFVGMEELDGLPEPGSDQTALNSRSGTDSDEAATDQGQASNPWTIAKMNAPLQPRRRSPSVALRKAPSSITQSSTLSLNTLVGRSSSSPSRDTLSTRYPDSGFPVDSFQPHWPVRRPAKAKAVLYRDIRDAIAASVQHQRPGEFSTAEPRPCRDSYGELRTETDIDEALDFERRKRIASQQRRMMVLQHAERCAAVPVANSNDHTFARQKTSPHKNRYNAAKERLAASHALAIPELPSSVDEETSVGDDGPTPGSRACVAKAPRNDVGKHRVKATTLPLEHIHSLDRVQNLSQVLDIDIEQMALAVQGDGADGHYGFDDLYNIDSNQTLAAFMELESKLLVLVSEAYKREDEDAPSLVVDLQGSFRESPGI